MLVLTRRVGESIIIGNGIKLTVISVGPGRVKVGIDAPRTVRIDREEVHDRIQSERAADVLEAVSACKLDPTEPATLVGTGPDTGVICTDGSDVPPGVSRASMPTPPENRLSRFRFLRKPR